MNKKIKWLAIIGGAVAAITLTVTNVVLADPSRTVNQVQDSDAAGFVCPGWAYYGGAAMPMMQVVSNLTGLTPEQVQDQLRDGQSLSQIAQSKGVTREALDSAIIAAETQAIQAQVTAGNITQAQADGMLGYMKDHMSYMLDLTGGGMMGWGWNNGNNNSRGFGPGGMMGSGFGGGADDNGANYGSGNGPGVAGGGRDFGGGMMGGGFGGGMMGGRIY